jgi:hypothetical protein
MAPAACCRLLDIQPLPHGVCLAFLILLHNYATNVHRLSRDSHQHDEIPHPHYLPSDTASCGYAQCGRRRLHHGVAIGFLPTVPKWATLDLTTEKSGATAVDTAEPPAWAIQDWLNYAYTPDLRWGDAAFCAYVVAAAVLALAAKERS